MFTHDFSFTADSRHRTGHCVISASSLLADVRETVHGTRHAYLIVEDDRGQPVGVVATEEIRRRLDTPNLAERSRWMEMPVEATIQGRMHIPPRAAGIVPWPEKLPPSGVPVTEASAPDPTAASSDSRQCTPICRDGNLIAVVTDDDVLVSWRSIENTLKNAQNDGVTGLPNRAAFNLLLQAEFSRSRRTDISLGVIIADVDHFKTINDRLGHAAGDNVLAAVGRALRQTLRSYDTVARFGGDEFAIICCGCQPGEIKTTLQRLQTSVKRLEKDVTLPRPLPTLSMGACVVHNFDQETSPRMLIEQADECLYIAKRSGRDCAFSTEIGRVTDDTTEQLFRTRSIATSETSA